MSDRRDGAPLAWLVALAAAALGLAIQQADGEYTRLAWWLVVLGLASATAAVAGLRPTGRGSSSWLILVGLFAVLLAIQFAQLLTHRPDSEKHSFLPPEAVASLRQYKAMLLIAGALTLVGVMSAAGVLGQSLLVRAWFPALLAVYVCIGLWVIVFTRHPPPRIDVWEFQQRAAEALFRRENPYEINDYPDRYRSGQVDPETGKPRQEVYGPGLSDGETLRFGYPYMPLTLYLAAVGRAAMDDVRYAHLFAMVLAAVFIRRAARDPATGALAAALMLFTPRAFFVLINGWTEPFNVMFLAATVYCAARKPRMLPVALGLLLAVKQYLILAVPLTVLLVPQRGALWGVPLPDWRAWLRLLLLAGLVAFAVTLPLALWNPGRFVYSAYEVQAKAPFRWDALSYLVHRAWGRGAPTRAAMLVYPAAAVSLATLLCLWRAPRTPAGLAAAVGLVHLAFFAFSKQAFANYYFFVIGAFCCAAAAAAPSAAGSDVVTESDPEPASEAPGAAEAAA